MPSPDETVALITRTLGTPEPRLPLTVGVAGDNVTLDLRGVVSKIRWECSDFVQAITTDSLGFGRKIVTLPAGQYLFVGGYTRVRAVSDGSAAVTATSEIGIGTTVASGAIEVLSGTAAFEDVMDGSNLSIGTLAAGGTFNDEIGYVPEAAAISSSSDIDLFLNIALDGNGAGDLTIDADVELIFHAFPNRL